MPGAGRAAPARRSRGRRGDPDGTGLGRHHRPRRRPDRPRNPHRLGAPPASLTDAATGLASGGARPSKQRFPHAGEAERLLVSYATSMRFFAVRRFKEVNAMMRWQVRFGRALLGLGAVLAL